MGSLRTRVLLFLAAAVGLVFLLDWLIETDREKIEKLFETARAAAVRGDVDTIMAQVDPAYSHDGSDFAAIRARVEQGLRQSRPERVQLFDPRLALSDETAKYDVAILLVPSQSSSSPAVGTMKFDLAIGLAKKNDRWWIVSIDEAP